MTPRSPMHRPTTLLWLLGVLGVAPGVARAQQPEQPRFDAPPPPPHPVPLPMPGAGAPRLGPRPAASAGRGAEFLLAHTGELRLTDQQVVRLAAIARRGAARREAMRARADSLRGTARPDSAMRAARPRAFAELQAQEHADLREAIAVLTADQVATAWELTTARGGPPRGMGGPPGAPGRPPEGGARR